MNHQFIETQEIDISKNIIKYCNSIYYKYKHKYFKCKTCNFITINIINSYDEKHIYDLFFFNNKEIYLGYVWYTDLSRKVNLTCEEFIIKDLLE